MQHQRVVGIDPIAFPGRRSDKLLRVAFGADGRHKPKQVKKELRKFYVPAREFFPKSSGASHSSKARRPRGYLENLPYFKPGRRVTGMVEIVVPFKAPLIDGKISLVAELKGKLEALGR